MNDNRAGLLLIGKTVGFETGVSMNVKSGDFHGGVIEDGGGENDVVDEVVAVLDCFW